MDHHVVKIAGDLFDLIGDAWFDFIQELLQVKHQVRCIDLLFYHKF